MRTPHGSIAWAVAVLSLTAAASSAGWSARITPRGGSGIRGSAIIESTTQPSPSSGVVEYEARVSLTGAPAGARLGWVVQEGKCGAPGDPLGPPSTYPPLTVDLVGAGAAQATISVALAPSASYSVSIHGQGSVIACGDFTGSD